MDGIPSKMVETTNVYRIFGGKFCWKHPHGSLGRKLENTVNMDLKEELRMKGGLNGLRIVSDYRFWY
jgi:hypothetical protein